MSNWDFVFAYDDRAAEWLAAQALPHPAVRPGNRFPTEAEAAAACQTLGFGPDSPIRVAFSRANPGEFKVRGDLLQELRLLRLLCASCGQLWLYPDTGEPAIVVDAALLPERTDATYARALAADDSWAAFHRSMYSSAPGENSGG